MYQNRTEFLPQNVVVKFNVLGAFIEGRIVGNLDSRLVVTIKWNRLRLREVQVL